MPVVEAAVAGLVLSLRSSTMFALVGVELALASSILSRSTIVTAYSI